MNSEQKRHYWQQHIEAWRQSQLHQKEYCKNHELSFASFGYWRTRLKRQSESTNKLVPVTLSRSTPVSIYLPSGIRIEIPVHALGEILPLLHRVVQEQD